MAQMRFYLDNHSAEIEKAENKFNYLPNMDTNSNIQANNYCLSKTLNLAKCSVSHNHISLSKLEQSLRQSRDWAAKIYK